MDFALLTQTFNTLRLAPPPSLTLLEAPTLTSAHVPPYPPELPALLMGVNTKELALHIKNVLLTAYPNDHMLYVVIGETGKSCTLADLSGDEHGADACWYIPALGEGIAFESFTEIVAHLRAPNGCPWDRAQTHATLRKHLLEEAYEVLSAIDSGDFADLREELGDLLLQIVLQSQIANEEGYFNIYQVIHGIHAKIVRRHPHVFGDVKLDGVEGVLANWEKLKEKERGDTNNAKGLLDGVSVSLPALSQAQEYQERAARVGFDWTEIEGVLDKIAEEIEEVRRAATSAELTAELGDLLFALVNLARWKNVDAESALRETNLKFKKRFGYVEQGAMRRGKNLSELTLDEMEALWQEAKTTGL